MKVSRETLVELINSKIAKTEERVATLKKVEAENDARWIKAVNAWGKKISTLKTVKAINSARVPVTFLNGDGSDNKVNWSPWQYGCGPDNFRWELERAQEAIKQYKSDLEMLEMVEDETFTLGRSGQFNCYIPGYDGYRRY